MELWGQIIPFIGFVQYELLSFALAGLLIGGIDDFTMDLLFLSRKMMRDVFIYSRYPRMTGATLPVARDPGALAVLIPAWHEAEVIGHMLRACLLRWRDGAFCIFVGTYPNDPRTIDAVVAVAEMDARIRLVILPHDGGTTKADCLNHCWNAMLREEVARGRCFKGVVLHDAEDVVHADEIRLFDVMTDRFDMVQLPVRPLLSPSSRWIAGHYADEFAEAHGKHLVLREAIGAAVPSAGVGCCIRRSMLGRIARERKGFPFDADSLTEDYELGLRIAEMDGKTVFVTMRDEKGGLICTREHFPETLGDAVRQKARWFVGIALAGWDRMGWHGSLQERWMRLHDRRAALSALVLFAAYLATFGYGIQLALAVAGIAAIPALSPVMQTAMAITSCLMVWRLAWRVVWSWTAYGWVEGLRSVPRIFIANIIAMMAARRAIGIYMRQLGGGAVVWDKTRHRFPTGGGFHERGAA